MVIYSREKVARLREQYPAGTRICLNSMDGEAGMPQGLEGTVQYVDDAGQLGVKWDNGRSLSLIPGVDSFHKKEGQGHPEEKPRKKILSFCHLSGGRQRLPLVPLHRIRILFKS